jgi:hypothetical protein
MIDLLPPAHIHPGGSTGSIALPSSAASYLAAMSVRSDKYPDTPKHAGDKPGDNFVPIAGQSPRFDDPKWHNWSLVVSYSAHLLF